tara:strand:+ start:477 stop:2000 length:1524 start_codon:yes stop_codon:yes gene_type:complete
MAIKKYVATKDNTITNAFGIDLATRATGSNMGASDILEVFSIYGNETTASVELSRTLLQFPVDAIVSDRSAGNIPASGSVKFFLRVFNARHSEQLPENFTVNVMAVSRSWQEGIGLDMETYKDKTKDSVNGSNWVNRTRTQKWNKAGGDYHSSSYVSGSTMPSYTFTFENGGEDIELDVTEAVEEWAYGHKENYGFGIFLTSSQEGYFSSSAGADSGSILQNTEGQTESFYTKRFFARGTEFFFKKPVIEARWDSRTTDDRGNFFASSSIASAADNLNNLYLYNYIRGRLVDIPHTETVTVNIFSSSADFPTGSRLDSATASKVSTGIYKAQVTSKATGSNGKVLSIIHDVWSGSVGGEYKTGSISVKTFQDDSVLVADSYQQYVNKITNLKPSYAKDEQARFRVFARPRNFSPTIYTVASKDIEKSVILSGSYEIIRMVDERTVIRNSTGSATLHTFLSYDDDGNYFDLDMALLEPGYMYGVKLAYYTSQQWREQEEVFKFRVEDN